MAFRRRSGSSWTTPNRIQRRSGSSWVDVENIYRRSGSSWIMVYQSYQALSVSAPFVMEMQPNFMGPTVVGQSTATTTGGKGTISYAWTHRSGPVLSVTGANSATASFAYTFPSSGGSVFSTYRITVSDGISSAHQDVTVNLTLNGPF